MSPDSPGGTEAPQSSSSASSHADQAAGAGTFSAWKIVLSVVAVTGAIAFLLSRSLKEGVQYYKHVDEVMSSPDAVRDKRLQVHGNVVNDSIEQARGTLQFRFKIESRPPRAPAVISAVYEGLVPDTFKSGAEVVASGTLTADNVLHVAPDGIMAKCPSKYDATKPGGGARPDNPAAASASAAAAVAAPNL
jgi:cytochrome c-type biogenesis protein CcmE